MKYLVISFIITLILILSFSLTAQNPLREKDYEIKPDTVTRIEIRKVTRSNSTGQVRKTDVMQLGTHNRHTDTLQRSGSRLKHDKKSVYRMDNRNPVKKEIKEINIISEDTE